MFAQRQNSGLQSFTLTDAQRQDAADAIATLHGANCQVTLKFVAEHFVLHARPAAGDITVKDLVERYREAKERKGLRRRSLADLKYRLGLFARTFGDKLVKDVQAQAIEDWLFVDPSWSAQTRRNFRTVLMGFFKHAIAQKFLAANPLLVVTNPVVEDSNPAILTVPQASALLNAAWLHPEIELLPYVALGLFCGIRSDELARLDWAAVDLKSNHVTISPQIAKKRRIRVVSIPKCCRAWLVAAGLEDMGPIRPLGFQRRWKKLLEIADHFEIGPDGKQRRSAKPLGLVPWPANALRHSAASYHFALHADSAKTCAMLGQKDDDVLFDHYRSLVKPADAKKFYALVPATPSTGKVIKLVANQ
jgi:integrase